MNELVFNYIINEMRPLITCEKRSFRELIMGLTGIKDTSILPNRIQIKAQLKSRYALYVQMITDLIQNHNYICTTADIWSSNNKSFMGKYIIIIFFLIILYLHLPSKTSIKLPN